MNLLLAAALALSASVAHLSATDEAVRESCLVGEIQRRFCLFCRLHSKSLPVFHLKHRFDISVAAAADFACCLD